MTPPEPSQDDDEIQKLVEQCILRFDAEGSGVVDEMCRDHPDHADELRSRMDTLTRLGFLGPERSPEIPERLGEFRLLERIGVGGMGVVYRALQESLGREVALKLVRPEHLYFPGARERFRREVEAVARLDHPGIVRVHQVGEEHGIPYFTMELARGASLAQLVDALREREPGRLDGSDMAGAWRALGPGAGGSRDESDSGTHALEDLFRGSYVQCVVRIVLQVAEALAHAHSRGVLHRDVKASNVMLTPDGRVLLLDFGLAWTEGGEVLTRSGAMLGSLPYMAPEQVRGDQDAIDERTDVHGLGALLYELLTLRLPHQTRDGERLRLEILQGLIQAPSRTNSQVPRDVETICLQALDPDPARRYPNAGRFAQDLRNFLEYRPIEARRPGLGDRLRRYAHRHPARATAIVAAVLVAALLPAVIILKNHETAAELRRLVDEKDEQRRIAERSTELALEQKRLAEDKGLAAETERRRAEAEARRAEENLARAAKEHERAEANLEQANQAIEKMVMSLIRNPNVESPDMDAVRRDLLEEALLIYEKLEPSDESSGRHTWKKAKALLHVAVLRARMGQIEQAEGELQQVANMLEGIPQEVTGREFIDCDLSLTLQELARLHAKTGRMSESKALFERALRTMREAVADHPEMWVQRVEFCSQLQAMANFAVRSGKPAEAETWLDEADAVLRDTNGGRETTVRLQEAGLLGDRGRVAQLRERFGEARAAYERGIALLTELGDRMEELDIEQRILRVRRLGDYGLNLCGLALEQKDEATAFARSGETLAWREALCELAPDRPDSVNLLAAARSIHGDLLMQRGRKDEGLVQLREAGRLHEALLERHPKDPAYRRRAGISLGTLAFKLEGDEARQWQAKARRIMAELVTDQPLVPSYRDDYGVLLIEIARRTAEPEVAAGILKLAEDQFRAAWDMQKGAARYKRNLALAEYESARRLVALGRLDEARDRLVHCVRELGFDARYLRREEFKPLETDPVFASLLR